MPAASSKLVIAFVCAGAAATAALAGLLPGAPDCGEAAPPAAGIRITCWHFGHFPDFPAIVSGTLKLCPHWQATRIGMFSTFIENSQAQFVLIFWTETRIRTTAFLNFLPGMPNLAFRSFGCGTTIALWANFTCAMPFWRFAPNRSTKLVPSFTHGVPFNGRRNQRKDQG